MRTGPPVGAGFVGFAFAIFALLALSVLDSRTTSIPRSEVTVGRLGVIITTIYGFAALVAAWRLIRTRNRSAALIVLAYVAGAAWCWSLLAQATHPGSTFTSIVGAIGTIVAAILLTQGLRVAYWLEVFSGLGLVSLVLGTTLVGPDSASWTGSLTMALLLGSGGMACLYGGLVDVEVAERRALVELLDSRQRIESEMLRFEEVLHDLRSGLLAVEAAIGSFHGDLADPLRSEVARLRRLTNGGDRIAASFDFAEKVRHLVDTRQAGGATVDLTGPSSAWVWGEESEVMSIVENLLSNATRHGEQSPVSVEITPAEDLVRLSVTNGGPGIGDPDAIFDRGVSTHPEGRGIGLSRARQLAEMNRAQLAVEPDDDGQTTFTLELHSEESVSA